MISQSKFLSVKQLRLRFSLGLGLSLVYETGGKSIYSLKPTWNQNGPYLVS